MKKSLKKRGQKFIRKFSRVSLKASEDGKEHIKENLFQRVSHIANIRLLILEWGLLVVALIMLAVTQAFWFGDSYAEKVWTNGGTYTEATLGAVSSMNPLFATTSSERVLSRLLFGTLAAVDTSGHPRPELAQYIVPSEDGKIWTLKLREGLKWSDGEPITNEDVMFTLGLIKNPAVTTIYDANLANVKITENENEEIVFTLSTAYADFISALNIPVVPKHLLDDADPKILVEDEFSKAPVGSGPFYFNAVQSSTLTQDETYYLSANPHYYKGSVMLGSFAVHTFATRDDIIGALNAGSVTATAELTVADADRIADSRFNQKNSSLNSGAFLFFNTSSEKVKNVEVRRAIRQGIDLAEVRVNAPETGALDYPIIESQIKLNELSAVPGLDKDAAKAKLAELKGEGEVTLELATVNTGVLPKVAEAIANGIRDLGYSVNVTAYEENQEFISNVLSKRNYDLLVYEVELGVDPDPLPYYHSSQASKSGLNLSNYRNALVDDLLLAGRETLDTSLRIKKYESFLEYWVGDVPAMGIYQPNLTYYYNRNVRPFSNDLHLVTALDRFADVTDWAVNTTVKNKTP